MSASIERSAFLKRNDMVWSSLPSGWSNAPFLGNGNLGTILWQTKAGDLHLEISRADLYDHRKMRESAGVVFGQCRLPNGSFSLSFGDKKPTGDMRLDLWNAELRGSLHAGGNTWQIRSLAEAKYDVIAIEITAPPSAKQPTLTWNPQEAKSPRKQKAPADLKAYPPQERRDIGDIHVSVQEMPADVAYHTDGLPGGQYATAWKTVDAGNGRQMILITTQLSYPGTTAAASAVEKIGNAVGCA